MSATTAEAKWTGWEWFRGRWRQVCVAETLPAASTLLEQKRKAASHLTCVTAGREPRFTPRGGNTSQAP